MAGIRRERGRGRILACKNKNRVLVLVCQNCPPSPFSLNTCHASYLVHCIQIKLDFGINYGVWYGLKCDVVNPFSSTNFYSSFILACPWARSHDTRRKDGASTEIVSLLTQWLHNSVFLWIICLGVLQVAKYFSKPHRSKEMCEQWVKHLWVLKHRIRGLFHCILFLLSLPSAKNCQIGIVQCNTLTYFAPSLAFIINSLVVMLSL